MAGFAHFAFGFGGKRLYPRIPLGIFLVASELLDILWLIFWLLGIENTDGAPWSHGLLMAIVWSFVSALLIIVIYRHIKSGIVIGLIVFSHWILDFITHPMGAVMNGKPVPPDLYLLFYNSPKVGLGLYNYSAVIAYIFEFSVLALGVIVYIRFIRKSRKQKENKL